MKPPRRWKAGANARLRQPSCFDTHPGCRIPARSRMAHNRRFSSTEWSGAMNIRQRIFGDAGSESPLVTVKKPKGAKADMLHSIPVHREESRRGDMRLGDRYRIVG